MAKSGLIKSFTRTFTFNLPYKILALVITILLSIFILGRDDVEESRNIDIVVKMPEHYSLVKLQPNVVNVTLMGNPKILRRYFDQKKSLVFEVHNTSANILRVEISEEKLLLPFGLELVEINPKFFSIEMQTKDGEQDLLQIEGVENDE